MSSEEKIRKRKRKEKKRCGGAKGKGKKERKKERKERKENIRSKLSDPGNTIILLFSQNLIVPKKFPKILKNR